MEYIKLSELKKLEGNPRTISKEDYKKLKDSVKKFGIIEGRPFLVSNRTGENIIIGGNQRYEVCKELGIKEVPVHIDTYTQEQEDEIIIRDNVSNGDWDMEILANEWDAEQLNDWGLDVPLPEIIDEDKEAIEDNIPEEPKTIYVEKGDIFQLGEHRLMCGDSTSIDDVEKLMDGEKADMVFTDPPYNVAFNGRSGKHDVIKNDDLSDSDFENFIDDSIQTIRAINPKNYYIWCNWDFYGLLQERLDYKSCIVWAKNVFGLGKGYRHQHEFCLFNGMIDKEVTNESDLWEIKKDTNYMHPTQKPVELSARAFKNHKKDKNVLDLFGGSGSTLIGCEKMGKKGFIMELDEKYIQVIIKRFSEYSPEKEIKCLNRDLDISLITQ